VGFGSGAEGAKLGGVANELPGDFITVGRLAEMIREIDSQDVVARAALLAAMRAAAWPTRSAIEN
jgi:hypothetical protein